ncbi:MAG TPA: glycosyltransferase, partial [Burkholderiales bacterium]|nr:glycosyltransferase [Burkholderiales bacterium]
SSRLRIIHMGSIHAAFRDPCPLFAALARMLGRKQLTASEIEIQFIGGGPYGDAPQMQSAIENAGLCGRVSFLPRVPYEESLRQLSGADLLLLLQASDDTAGLVPAKLYEYLRAQKPTLALVPTGAVTEVIAETGGGWTADPSDAASLDMALAEIVHAWRADRLGTHCANLDALRRFDRRALTAELAAVFDGVCARKRA